MRYCVFAITDRHGVRTEFRTPDTGPFGCWTPAIAETRRVGFVNGSPIVQPHPHFPGLMIDPNPEFLRFEEEDE